MAENITLKVYPDYGHYYNNSNGNNAPGKTHSYLGYEYHTASTCFRFKISDLAEVQTIETVKWYWYKNPQGKGNITWTCGVQGNEIVDWTTETTWQSRLNLDKQIDNLSATGVNSSDTGYVSWNITSLISYALKNYSDKTYFYIWCDGKVLNEGIGIRYRGYGYSDATRPYLEIVYSTGPTDLSTGTVEGTFNPSTFTYNGTNQYPSSYNIYYNGSLLIEGQDYNLSWPSDSYSVGTKDVEITGIGNYTGTVIINNAYEITGILIEDITLSPLEDSIIIGDTIQIEKTIYPEDATIGVIWSSTNPSIASVNNKGLVTGLSEGTTTIYCSSEFDSSIYGMSKITVTSATIGVTKIILTSNGTSEIKETLMRSDHSLHLYPVITPDNATNQNLKWKSSNESIATVFASEYGTAGIVYSNDLSGEVTITCTSEDNPSVSASCKITVIKFSITPSQIEVMEGETGTFFFSVEPASYLSQVVASPALGNFSTSISNNIITIYNVKYDTSEYGNNLGTFYIYIAGYGSTYFYHNNSVIILPAPERIPVTGLSLDKENLTLRVEKDIGTVTATISPENASNLNIIWENDDNIFDKCIETSISTLNNTSTITIIPVKAGTVTLTAYAEENREIIATCIIKITDLGSVYIYIDGEYKPAKAYIYNGGWQECSSIYIYNNGWKQTITI